MKDICSKKCVFIIVDHEKKGELDGRDVDARSAVTADEGVDMPRPDECVRARPECGEIRRIEGGGYKVKRSVMPVRCSEGGFKNASLRG